MNFHLVYSYGYGSVKVMAVKGAGRDKCDIINDTLALKWKRTTHIKEHLVFICNTNYRASFKYEHELMFIGEGIKTDINYT